MGDSGPGRGRDEEGDDELRMEGEELDRGVE